jgi:hypothetical protein
VSATRGARHEGEAALRIGIDQECRRIRFIGIDGQVRAQRALTAVALSAGESDNSHDGLRIAGSAALQVVRRFGCISGTV